MISTLSNLITQNLLKKDIISNKEKELYAYGLFMIISYLAFFIISILFGIALDIPFLSILFYIVFCLVRNFAGGIHADSETRCDIITTLSILISEILIKIFINYSLVRITFVLIISSISLIAIKPVASSQKEINKQEKMHFHKKVIVLTALALIISIISILFGVYSIAISISISLSLATILLVLGKLKQIIK